PLPLRAAPGQVATVGTRVDEREPQATLAALLGQRGDRLHAHGAAHFAFSLRLAPSSSARWCSRVRANSSSKKLGRGNRSLVPGGPLAGCAHHFLLSPH